MALNSPGVEVKVIDESFYTPAAPGTVPLIVVASAENKLNGSGDGIAPGTLKINSGKVYLMTSQRELVDTFGDPVFKTDANNNPVHAGEQNEYGLQTAYNILGVTSRAYVVRADVDLNQLNPRADAPQSGPANGTHWLDTQVSRWGIFEWNDNPITTTGGQTFVNKVPTVITDVANLDLNTGGPADFVGSKGSYAIVAVTTGSAPALTDQHPLTLWYKAVSSSLNVVSGQWIQVGSADWIENLTADGLAPKLAISSHTKVPQWKHPSTEASVAPTGSVWIKTTEINAGAQLRVKRYNEVTQQWESPVVPLYANAQEALFGLDKSGGGVNLPVGQMYAKYNVTEDASPIADFKIYRKRASAPTIIRTPKVTGTTFDGANNTTYTFDVVETSVGSVTPNTATISFTLTSASESNITAVVSAINNSESLTYVRAEPDGQNRIVITHAAGGDIHFTDGDNTPLAKLGFEAYDPTDATGMLNLYDDLDQDHDYVASLWEPLVYVASATEPNSGPADGTLWYSSVNDEVDIMVNDGTTWKGYRNVFVNTDESGPFVQASEPETQRDGTPLENNDIWVSTADSENFPMIYKYNKDLQKWLLVDNSDQSTDEGILFADARYNTSGANGDQPGDIVDLLSSDYLDPDAPDPALYPQGMLLWNLRRSGSNVKRFVENYIDVTKENIRFNDELMTSYATGRWVTASANQDDGSGSFGRKAQRKVVVQALQALVNSNQDIRDDESRIFNLIACPGYPELIGEMVNLNYDRGLTAFVIGDTPARLSADATSLLAWGSNENLAVEDNDIGAVSFDEYMGMFYPWGFSSDNFGRNIVVPPSHMILRTFINNDQIAYPWFAAAGVRRGGVTNATSVGYVDAEGEFKAVALNTGQRDTLYEQKINPITFITGTGLVNYGQKTRARAASALDRINVARLVIYLRRQLGILAKPYIFEPNDQVTREEIKGAVETLMVELVGQRALYDFIVVCDETNNTPARIDRNELWIDIAIEPTKAVEFIYIPLRLKNTGEISGLQ